MKKSILSSLLGLGLASSAFAAGTYTENFDNYAGGATSGFTNGAILLRNGDGVVYHNSPWWKALKLVTDNAPGANSTFVISGVEKSGQPINVISANFGLYFKNSGGLNAANIADRFSFNFGNVSTTDINPHENGTWTGSGNLLSVVWDFYDNDTTDGAGDSNNNDRIGIEIYKNGTLLANSFRAINPTWVYDSLGTGAFDAVNISWSKDTGKLDMSIAGTSVYSSFDLGGFNPGLSDTRFGFSAATGAESMDVFVDNISISTVPEPSAASLLVLGIGGLMALRRRK